MNNTAFIPVRGGSKSIPLKNIKKIAGRPLIYWTLKAASESSCIDKIYVATDSEIIKATVEGFAIERVSVISRSPESASDTASTELAMLEFAESYDFDNIVLIQATSPLLTGDDLDKGFKLFSDAETDSVLSVVRQKRFVWQANEKGTFPVNYDYLKRPRRQEFDGYLVENGAFYITSKNMLLSSGCRISGRVAACEMPEETYYEIDEPSDWVIIENLLRRKYANIQKLQLLNKIKLFITDSDGCLTDGGMYYSENGDELKKFNTKDGMAFQLLKQNNIIIGIISGERVKLLENRAKKLKLDELYMGVSDKLEILKKLAEKYKISFENIAYVGDDINDLEVIKAVGFSACPKDAVASVKNNADYICKVSGGNGVIREVADYILGNSNE